MRIQLLRKALFCLLVWCSFGVSAAQTQLKDIRVWHSPDSSRVVLDFTSKPSYKTFFLDNPARFVVDLYQSTNRSKAPNANTGQYLSRF